MKFLVTIYGHPEFYPPTLNAINELSKKATSINVLGRNVRKTEWNYPKNVRVHLSGKYLPKLVAQKSPIWKKIIFFFSFTWSFYRLILKNRPDWVLCYDAIPLLVFRIVRILFKTPPRIWYHNHDVMKIEDLGKYSVGWWAVKSEKKFFRRLDIFSIPSMERLTFFPTNQLKGKFFYLPNFPSISFYKRFKAKPVLNGNLNLIYQGTICKNHGIEELMHYIHKTDKQVSLSLIGYISDEYKNALKSLIEELNIGKNVNLLDPVSYSQLPDYTSKADVGIAINIPDDIMYATGGTASNKIYEYAAVGLPIFYYDTSHYRKYLGKYDWAFPTDLSVSQLDSQVEKIMSHYKTLSGAALKDFETELNFEVQFKPISNYLYSESLN